MTLGTAIPALSDRARARASNEIRVFVSCASRVGCRYVFGNRYFNITDGPACGDKVEEGYVDGAG